MAHKDTRDDTRPNRAAVGQGSTGVPADALGTRVGGVPSSLHADDAWIKVIADVGHVCLAAVHPAGLARRVLSTLTLHLGGVAGWLGLPTSDGVMRVYDALGPCAEPAALADSARALTLGVPDGASCSVGVEASALFPGVGAGGDGLCAPFRTADGMRGWLLLVGPPEHGLAANAEQALAISGVLIGLALAKQSSAERGRAGPATPPASAPALDIERERDSWAGERAEGLHRLAAGLAHELNNPLGAALANLDYVVEGLASFEASHPTDPHGERAEIARAAADARGELRRLAESVTTRLGQAVESRRAAVRSAVENSVREAIARYVEARPGARAPAVRVLEPLACGVPMSECARWILRVLLQLRGKAREARSISLVRTELGPCVRIRAAGPGPARAAGLSELAREMSPVGIRLRVAGGKGRLSVELVLPPALGESNVIWLMSHGSSR